MDAEKEALRRENQELQAKIAQLERKITQLENQLNPPKYQKVLGFTIREYNFNGYRKWRAIKTVCGYQFCIHIPKYTACDTDLIEKAIVAWLDKYPDKKKLFIRKFPEYISRIPGGMQLLLEETPCSSLE